MSLSQVHGCGVVKGVLYSAALYRPVLVNIYHDHTGAPVGWRSRSGGREGEARVLTEEPLLLKGDLVGTGSLLCEAIFFNIDALRGWGLFLGLGSLIQGRHLVGPQAIQSNYPLQMFNYFCTIFPVALFLGVHSTMEVVRTSFSIPFNL